MTTCIWQYTILMGFFQLAFLIIYQRWMRSNCYWLIHIPRTSYQKQSYKIYRISSANDSNLKTSISYKIKEQLGNTSNLSSMETNIPENFWKSTYNYKKISKNQIITPFPEKKKKKTTPHKFLKVSLFQKLNAEQWTTNPCLTEVNYFFLCYVVSRVVVGWLVEREGRIEQKQSNVFLREAEDPFKPLGVLALSNSCYFNFH